MCLAIPGRITQISQETDLMRMGKVNFGGIVKEINLSYVPEATLGDYVIVHVGFAISQVEEEEAKRIFEYLAEMEDLSELSQEPS